MSTPPVLLVYSHNNLYTLPALLHFFSVQTPIIVVDDASTDGSRAPLRAEESAGHLTLITREGQPNRAEALNAGFALAAHRFPGRDVLRLHADTLPCPPDGGVPGAFVTHLSAALHDLPNCGVLGVRMVSADGRILSEGRTTVSGLGLHSPDRALRHLSPDTPPVLFGSTPEADSVSGACVLYSHALLQAVNALGISNAPLDATYGPAGLEDDDLCFAARLCGFEVRVVPWLRAVQLGVVTPPEGSTAPILHQLLNREQALIEAQTEYWKRKWGWDLLLPDLNEVRRLYEHGCLYEHSRVCWQINDRWDSTERLPGVDLCMVTWNGERVLRRCLESLAQTDYPADKLVLHIIDNASTDATPAILREFASRCLFEVRITRLDVNVGAVAGLNWAFTQGDHPLVAKLDDDIIVPSHWLKDMAAVFGVRPYAGVVGPCIVNDNAERRVQCADFSFYPTLTCHEGEPEAIQWPGLARVTHVRGCCNLYRRSTFARCGMLDLRYSPSQWDDPDHHIALLHAGYEVIYAGHVHVAHKCLTGTPPGPDAAARASLNKAAMFTKWGISAPELLECALLFSREGRFLPTNAAELAPVALTPPDSELTQQLRERHEALYHDDNQMRALSGMGAQLRDAAQTSLARGQLSQALGELRTAVCCGAADARFSASLAALAHVLEQFGVPAPLQRHLADTLGTVSAPALPALEEVPAVFPSTPPPFPQNAVRRVRFRVPHTHRFDAPLRDLLDAYAHALRAEGVAVELDCSAGGEQAASDSTHVTHLWTLDSPHETLSQLAYLRQDNATAVLTPLWRPAVHDVWAGRLLDRLRAGQPVGLDEAPATAEGDVSLLRRMALDMAYVLPTSTAEARLLNLPELFAEQSRILPLPPLSLPAVLPENFRAESGLQDYVLAVAPFHAQANQATLLAGLATANLGLPVVLVGKAHDPWYLRACRQLAPSALFVDEMDDGLLASAFAGARLVALPSLEPCGHTASRAALTAWQMGKPVVVAADSAESALSGAIACNPLDPGDVARALAAALKTTPPLQTQTSAAHVLLQAYAALPDFLPA